MIGRLVNRNDGYQIHVFSLTFIVLYILTHYISDINECATNKS